MEGCWGKKTIGGRKGKEEREERREIEFVSVSERKVKKFSWVDEFFVIVIFLVQVS